jgi:hypothetical protein
VGIIEVIARIVVSRLFGYAESDEAPVFVYVLAFQLLAIVTVVSLAGWSAFSRPW